MSINTVLKKVADQRLAEHRFVKSPKKSTNTWCYERPYGNDVLRLKFQKSQLDSSIVLYNDYFHTLNISFDVNDFPPYLSCKLKEGRGGYISYKNEQELELIIVALIDAVIDKVIPIYDIFVRPDKHPSFEMYKSLSKNTQLYAEKFMHEYHLVHETEIPKVKRCVKEIEKIIYENRNRNCDELLLCAAAYFGELIIGAHKGKWGWDDDILYYDVLDVNDNNTISGFSEKVVFSSLFYIYSYWDKPEITYRKITLYYQGLLCQFGIEEDYYTFY